MSFRVHSDRPAAVIRRAVCDAVLTSPWVPPLSPPEVSRDADDPCRWHVRTRLLAACYARPFQGQLLERVEDILASPLNATETPVPRRNPGTIPIGCYDGRMQRYWMPAWILMLTGAGGCSLINDFDQFEFTDAGPNRDSGNPADGGNGDGSLLDGGGSVCTGNCLGDIVRDFSMTQSAGVLQWRYLRDMRDPRGLIVEPLIQGQLGSLRGWIQAGGDGPPPAIVSCVVHASEPECAGIANHLLIAPDTVSVTGSDPEIEFTAPTKDTYRIEGSIRVADGVTATEQINLVISRNTRKRHD